MLLSLVTPPPLLPLVFGETAQSTFPRNWFIIGFYIISLGMYIYHFLMYVYISMTTRPFDSKRRSPFLLTPATDYSNMLQHTVATRGFDQKKTTALLTKPVWYSVVRRVAVRCSVLQCVAVCCSALQCVAVCCSVLQCVAATRLIRTTTLLTN